MNDTPINRTALIKWQQQALSHHRLAQHMEINATQRRVHREAARIYSECADGLLALLKSRGQGGGGRMKEIEAPETRNRWEGVQPEMVEMFEEADAHSVWFHAVYQNIWFTPDELAAHQRAGTFRWGIANFKLRDPRSRLEQLQNEVLAAQRLLEKFVARMRATHEN
ncbi:MAG: hypothetical protein ACE10K_14840 [Rhodothermales bacterium]